MIFNQVLTQLKEHSRDTLGSGTEESKIQSLELDLNIKLPAEFRNYLLEIGYAEISGDEIYSIYEVPDKFPYQGLHWNNIDNPMLSHGYLEFFSNDTDGVFYLNLTSGEIFINDIDSWFADSFSSFIKRLL